MGRTSKDTAFSKNTGSAGAASHRVNSKAAGKKDKPDRRQGSDAAIELLEGVIPFRFLSSSEKKKLIKDLREYTFRKGETIYSKGDSEDSMFLIKKGAVETIDYRAAGTVRINVITSGHYFGERSAIFNQKRIYTVRALSDVQCYTITGRNFRKLIHSSKAFSKAMSTILKNKQGIFAAFERFKSEVLQGINKGSMEIRDLIPFYREMEPALHTDINNSEVVDTLALDYAIKRLPGNVTENFIYVLIDELYEHIPEPWKLFDPSPALARRRRCWKMMPGQTMMLYRPGITDLLDLITCLCVLTVEAEKIKTRLSEHRILLAIKNHLSKNQLSPKDKEKSDSEFLKTLPFSGSEIAGLKTAWPEDTVKYLYQAALHSGIFHLVIKRQLELYNTRRSEMWLTQIGDAVRELTGFKANELPSHIKVHIISSNTHSVINCLNSSLLDRMEEIIAWGEKNRHPVAKKKWHNRHDMLYALSRDFLDEEDEKNPGSIKISDGIIKLDRTVSTGIRVQIFSLCKLVNKNIDPGLPEIPARSKSLILNIDYAFGEQASEIMRNLLLQFGKNLGSINILGKAGALLGNRGDILLPDAFIGQSEDLFLPVENRAFKTINRLQNRLAETKIYRGPMLTVDGTLFQNSMMLSFYRHIWDCIGLEMEGVYYLRQIIEARQHGLIADNIPMNFYYYVSDLPASPKNQLSTGMNAFEGIPPLYAVTREVLTDIFTMESVFNKN